MSTEREAAEAMSQHVAKLYADSDEQTRKIGVAVRFAMERGIPDSACAAALDALCRLPPLMVDRNGAVRLAFKAIVEDLIR